MSGKKLFAAGMVILAAAACRVEPAQVPEAEKIVLEATIEDASTKVAFDNLVLTWEPGDKIYVIPDSRTWDENSFTNVSESAGKTARFEGSVSYQPDEVFYALYPYETDFSMSGKDRALAFNKTQTVPAEGVDRSHLLLWGEGRYTLNFKPLVGLLKFVVEDEGVDMLIIAPYDGAVNISYEGTYAGVRIKEDGSIVNEYGVPRITVFPSEGSFVPGKPYYIACLPFELNGICVMTGKGDKYYAKTSATPLKVEAGKVYSLGTFSGMDFSYSTPAGIFTCNGLSSYSSLSSYAQRVFIGEEYDLAAHTKVTPEGYVPQDRKYLSFSDKIQVSADGKVSASGVAMGKVRVMSAINPAVYLDVWFDFSGIKKDAMWFTLSEDGSADVTNSKLGSASPGDYSGVVTIPASIEIDGKNYNVRGIDERCFYGCEELTRVIIPEGVYYINVGAFDHCTALESVNLPKSIVNLPSADGNSLFENCPKLSISSESSRYTVDESGNLISNNTTLLWLCEKTTGTNKISDAVAYIGSGSGCLYNSLAARIVFPAGLKGAVFVNHFRGTFPNLEEIVVDWPTYAEFESHFSRARIDDGGWIAGIFSKIRNKTSPVKLSVPAGSEADYAAAIADYGFSEIITH